MRSPEKSRDLIYSMLTVVNMLECWKFSERVTCSHQKKGKTKGRMEGRKERKGKREEEGREVGRERKKRTTM